MTDDGDRRYGGLFTDEAVDITGQIYINAVFDGCIITCRGHEPQIPGCIFTACQFIGDGWPNSWPHKKN